MTRIYILYGNPAKLRYTQEQPLADPRFCEILIPKVDFEHLERLKEQIHIDEIADEFQEHLLSLIIKEANIEEVEL